MMSTLAWPTALILFIFAPITLADNGMDMNMDGAMALASGQMLPYFHFTPGDVLWFRGWVPKTPGAIVGSCLGLFMLGLVDRWLAAIRRMAETHLQRRAHIILTNRLGDPPQQTSHTQISQPNPLKLAFLGSAPPFLALHNTTPGILHAGQMALNFAFMLAIMTYQVAFILAIITGLGVGETLFGRYVGDLGINE